MSVNPEVFFFYSGKTCHLQIWKKNLQKKEFLPFGLFFILKFWQWRCYHYTEWCEYIWKNMHWFSESGYFELVLLFLKTRNYKEVNVWPIFGQGQCLLLVMFDNRSMHWFGNIVFSRKGSLKWFWHHKIQETINRGVVVVWFILLHKSTFSKRAKAKLYLSNFTINMPPKCYFLPVHYWQLTLPSDVELICWSGTYEVPVMSKQVRNSYRKASHKKICTMYFKTKQLWCSTYLEKG